MTPLPASTDVFVIGGGPAGLAAAIAARRKGYQVTVADSAVPPVDKACGEGIMPDGLAAARSLGLELDAAPGHVFRGIRFRDRGAAVQAEFPHGVGRGVRRTGLHLMMVEAAADAGVRMLWGTGVTGIAPEGVWTGGEMVRARWIVGADGGNSRVRKWAGLDAAHRESRRYGFRRHYRVQDPGDYMELHWGDNCQMYLTPVGEHELCAVLISRDPRKRLSTELAGFPEAAARLAAAESLNHERGGITATRRLRAVARGNVALVGDASGSVDAITGEGLCLLFQHATALAAAIETGSLEPYREAHRHIGRRPEFMSDMMLLLDGRHRLRRRAIRAMAGEPRLFARMLALHVGDSSFTNFLAGGLALGWRMVSL
ncbi:MAG: NAD(P)/FAD-dependent oxidoreductase [Acidobacteria bacterium]|nr:NAD(P)/FAD-dependent oxidoreductase [Acidobacteriota bacterium]